MNFCLDSVFSGSWPRFSVGKWQSTERLNKPRHAENAQHKMLSIQTTASLQSP